jgi:hypothetical protein
MFCLSGEFEYLAIADSSGRAQLQGVSYVRLVHIPDHSHMTLQLVWFLFLSQEISAVLGRCFKGDLINAVALQSAKGLFESFPVVR